MKRGVSRTRVKQRERNWKEGRSGFRRDRDFFVEREDCIEFWIGEGPIVSRNFGLLETGETKGTCIIQISRSDTDLMTRLMQVISLRNACARIN